MLIRTGVHIIHAVEFGGGTKPMSMSTRCQVGCPAVEKLASLQQAPGRLHDETWAGRVGNLSLPISQVVEIVPRCADMVTCLLPPFFSSVSPGPGREVRIGVGWTSLEKTARSGVWVFRCTLAGISVFFALAAAGDWVKKGSFLAAWAVHLHFLRVLVHMRMGKALLSGHILGSGAGHCLIDFGGLSLP